MLLQVFSNQVFSGAWCLAYELLLGSLEHSNEIDRYLLGSIAAEDRWYFHSCRAAMGY